MVPFVDLNFLTFGISWPLMKNQNEYTYFVPRRSEDRRLVPRRSEDPLVLDPLDPRRSGDSLLPVFGFLNVKKIDFLASDF